MTCEETILSSYARRRAAYSSLLGEVIQGIDHVEVLDHDAPADDLRWRILLVHCFQPITDVTRVEVRITGDLESVPPAVEWVYVAGQIPDSLQVVYDQRGSRRVLTATEHEKLVALGSGMHGLMVHIVPRLEPVEDEATYTLHLLTGDVEPLDPRLSRATFAFHGEGPAENDCAAPQALERARTPTPPIDYLAKDYASFRRLMLDRMAVIMPAWDERTPADIGVALVEILAYAGDQLSYFQDAIATEAYLGTARRRTSVRRHARLLDYALHEGNNARVWISLEVDAEVVIPERTQLITRLERETSGALEERKLADALRQGALFFETMCTMTAIPARNCIPFYDWGGSLTCISQGATQAALACCKNKLGIEPGDVLIVEEIDELSKEVPTAPEQDRVEIMRPADQKRRHVVCVTAVREVEDRVQRYTLPSDTSVPDCYRVIETDASGNQSVCPVVTLVTWHIDDALPFSLPIRHPGGAQAAVARGNVVLADHGRTVTEALEPATAREKERYRPYLVGRDITHRAPFDRQSLRAQPARVQLTQDPRKSLPVVLVHEVEEVTPSAPCGQELASTLGERPGDDRAAGLEPAEGERSTSSRSGEKVRMAPRSTRPVTLADPATGTIKRYTPWFPRRDLLASGPFERHVAIEVARDGIAQVRFGDNVNGRRPSRSSRWQATYRLGNGSTGNIGADAITHVLVPENYSALNGVTRVRNPLPAEGGMDPERDQQARLYAPYTFRQGERAVTADDYANLAERHPEVQKAVAMIRWTGSWDTVYVVIDRRGGLPIDAPFEAELRSFLEPYRMAGQDLEFEPPIFVPLDIAITVHVAPDYLQNEVKRALLAALGSGESVTGKRGFFHPDNITFGDPVYLSDIVATAMEVPGVVWVDTSDAGSSRNRFQRLGEPARGEIGEGRIVVGPLEIVRVDNDPRAPQNGRLRLYMEGGL